MSFEKTTEWAQSWDKPIGALIDSFTDFDRDFVAVLQAQLLTIHRAGTGENLFKSAHDSTDDAKNTDLFALLKTGASGIGLKLKELAINHNNVPLARADVDKGKGMPREVPPFGLIAKSIGFVAPEVCDQLLIAQAAARILKYSQARDADIPAVHDAVNEKIFSFIGKNDKEPPALQEAQSYAHLALVHRALAKQAGVEAGFDYSPITRVLVTECGAALSSLGMKNAADHATAIVSALPLNETMADAKFRLATGISMLHPPMREGNVVEFTQQANIIHHRMLLISAASGTNHPPVPKPTL